METSMGRKGRQAHIILTYDLAHINLETTRTEASVPAEQGTTSQLETGVGPQGKGGSTSLFRQLPLCSS